MTRILEQHRAVYEAIVSRNGDRARSWMTVHVAGVDVRATPYRRPCGRVGAPVDQRA
ncbi:FCD domain-containing protein [Streptomyces sp. NBC_00347]|uniref:FCD domain-containing protein n=1 Tax=Streptomyces sp. NBC_00347 TaxID=2975721 RepID=UPI00225BEC19|nr:FCD domain-containing protein [Streptomyces sp. NBC_00347]MCX5126698.1 FCD domain-containing protein [Streptomyces sp. NBC_00347]